MNLLPHTWDALLARFGRLTDIQAKATGPLLAGHNCMLVSATASGKTEAALAPLLERQLQRRFHAGRRAGLQTLFIVPTRALTRDLARRLEEPLAKLALTLAIKTGDEPALKPHRPPDVLLTTPESFDSLLANRPRLLKDVRAVIVDELHLYEDTARGDQLRVLLSRLRRLRKFAHEQGDALDAGVQFCALSATIEQPALVAARYFADPVLIESPGQREIEAEMLAFDGPVSLRELFARLASRGTRKVLAFCQSKTECESLAQALHQSTPFGDRVYAHHASLAARMRHAVEDQFTKLDAALCLATSTLELGIDIGDVDLILLIGPPTDVASFLQRVGRGNRRTRRTRVVCFYRDEREHALFRVLLKQARQGAGLPASGNALFRPSVVAQQLFSYVKQARRGEIDPDHAYQLFHSPQGEPFLPKQQYDQIIERLLAENYFAPSRAPLLKPGVKWEELNERREIYANIGGDGETIEIVDEMTGRRLGYLEHRLPAGATFTFGGQTQRAKRSVGRKLFVAPTSGKAATVKPRWRVAARPLRPALVRSLALELGLPIEGNALPIILIGASPLSEEDVSAAWENEELNVGQQAVLLHCAGYAYGLVLGDLLEKSGDFSIEQCDELSLTLNAMRPIAQLSFSEADVAACVHRRWRQFESWFDAGRWRKLIPPSVRAAHVVSAFRIEEFTNCFGRSIEFKRNPLFGPSSHI